MRRLLPRHQGPLTWCGAVGASTRSGVGAAKAASRGSTVAHRLRAFRRAYRQILSRSSPPDALLKQLGQRGCVHGSGTCDLEASTCSQIEWVRAGDELSMHNAIHPRSDERRDRSE